jgi:hypothetical protein
MSNLNPVTSLDAHLGVLGLALAQWRVRDDTKAHPDIRHAANAAMAAIDDMLTTLHRLRQQPVTEVRRSDDANAARVDAMLAGMQAGDGGL